MPDRIIRAKILTSEKVDRLEAPAEVFYRRLINVVDDFGRYDARPSILRAACYPLRTDKLREADILRSLAACQSAELIALYEVGGKPYLELLNLQDRRRAKHSKYPPPTSADSSQPVSPTLDDDCQTGVPPSDNICQQVSADVGKCRQMRPDSDSDSDSDAHSDARSGAPPPVGKTEEPDPLVVGVRKFIQDHPRLIWNQRMQDRLVDLVREKGWPWCRSAIEGRLDEGDGDPIGTLLNRRKRNGTHQKAEPLPSKTVVYGER